MMARTTHARLDYSFALNNRATVTKKAFTLTPTQYDTINIGIRIKPKYSLNQGKQTCL